VVASAAIHGLLLLAWLGWESPASATNAADEVIIELVSIDVAEKQQVSAAMPAPHHNITKTTTVRQPIKKSAPVITAIKKTAPLLAQARARIQNIPEQPVAQPLQLADNRKTQPKQQAQPARFNQPIANQSGASKKTDTNQSRLLIRNHLESFKYYPASARRRGIEGRVEVGFTLTHDGAADQVAVLHGSGYAVLDHAALETVYRAQPFPVAYGQYRFSLRFKRL